MRSTHRRRRIRRDAAETSHGTCVDGSHETALRTRQLRVDNRPFLYSREAPMTCERIVCAFDVSHETHEGTAWVNLDESSSSRQPPRRRWQDSPHSRPPVAYATDALVRSASPYSPIVAAEPNVKELAMLALDAAKSAGAEYADVRFVRNRKSESFRRASSACRASPTTRPTASAFARSSVARGASPRVAI